MTTDFRALCAELLDLLRCFGSTFNIPIETSVVTRARTLLAQPEGEELTDEALLELMPQQFRDDLATVSRLASYGTPVEPGIYRVSLNTGALDFARAVEVAVLARRPTLPEADGEELTDEKLLRMAAAEIGYEFTGSWFLTGRNSLNLEVTPLELLNLTKAVLARQAPPNLAETRSQLGDAPQPPTDAKLASTHYEWELQDAQGNGQAGGSANSLDDVNREGTRYLQTYAQDGPHKLIIRQHTTQTIDEMTNG